MIRRPPRSTLFPYHDALPIWPAQPGDEVDDGRVAGGAGAHAHHLAGARARDEEVAVRRDGEEARAGDPRVDRKSTRLNSSHANISYAVFCLKKKKNKHQTNKI